MASGPIISNSTNIKEGKRKTRSSGDPDELGMVEYDLGEGTSIKRERRRTEATRLKP